MLKPQHDCVSAMSQEKESLPPRVTTGKLFNKASSTRPPISSGLELVITEAFHHQITAYRCSFQLDPFHVLPA